MNALIKQYDDQYSAMSHEAEVSPLTFRKKARDVMAAFTREQRRESRFLTTSTADPLDFYQAWDEIVPDVRVVQEAPAVKSVIKSLQRHLVLEEATAVTMLQRLSSERLAEIYEKLLSQVYPDRERRAVRAARKVLQRDEQAVRAQWTAYVNYALYKACAQEHGYVVYDRQALLLSRLLTGLTERVQVKRFVRRTTKLIEKNQRQVAALEAQDEGILSLIFSLRIDLVAMRAAHRRYEKAHQALALEDQQKPSLRLALYEKEAAELRSQHLESLPAVETLQDIRKAADEVDRVLLRIFDMDTRSYNELMSRMKQYRELIRERDRLGRLVKQPA